MARSLNDAEREVLAVLSQKKGIVFLRGEDAKAAIGLADTDFIALGADAGGGAVAAAITDEGRQALMNELCRRDLR